MENSYLIKKTPLYNSWIALALFVFILIFQPNKATFYAMRPSDGWLLFCLINQYRNGCNIAIPFKNRLFIRNFGLYLGALAIVATLIQASYAYLTFNISFVFHFYRFLRFLLIFKFVENIFSNFSSDDANKFWRIFTFMGIIALILSFLEFFGIQPYKQIIIDNYYAAPEETLDEYIINVERLAGLMGSANHSAIFLVTTLIYPLLKIVNDDTPTINKTIFTVYVFAIIYVLVIMSASRAAIFISLLMLVFILIAATRRLKEALSVLVMILLLTISGIYLHHRFGSEIIIQDRITEAMRGEKFELSTEGIGKWTGRNELWKDRFNTFQREGNPISVLIGLGYTKAYEDYYDNGIIGTFMNNGLIGLILKLFLFYVFIKFGFFRAIRFYREKEIDLSYLVFAFGALTLLFYESTGDMTDHYKLGQLFYLFLSVVLVANGKVYMENRQ